MRQHPTSVRAPQPPHLTGSPAPAQAALARPLDNPRLTCLRRPPWPPSPQPPPHSSSRKPPHPEAASALTGSALTRASTTCSPTTTTASPSHAPQEGPLHPLSTTLAPSPCVSATLDSEIYAALNNHAPKEVPNNLLAPPFSAEPRVPNPLLRQARSLTVHLLRRHLASALITLVFAEVSSPFVLFPLPHRRSLRISRFSVLRYEGTMCSTES
jgi:hypothetical protein